MSRASLRTLACAVFLCLLPFTLYLPVTLGGRTLLPADNLFQYEPWRSDPAAATLTAPNGRLQLQNELASDLILQNYAWKGFIRDSIRAGELPLWNPYLFAGVPFLAAGQHSALYPFSILFLLLPLSAAYGWFMASQLALAGLSMFALIRTYGLRRPAAVFAGVAFQLCGLLVVGVVHPMIVASVAWLPLILALVDKLLRTDPGLGGRPASLPWAVLGAAAIGCHLLAGHVEISVYTALVTTAYAIYRLLTSGRLRERGYAASRIAWLALFGAGGALLAAIQLVPLFELVTQNFRGAGRSTFEQVLSYAFPVRYMLLWLMPNLYGSWGHHAYFDWFSLRMEPATALQGTWWGYSAKEQVESSVYVGLGTLLMAVVGAALGLRSLLLRRDARDRVPVPFFVALAGLSLLFIFGTPAYGLLYYGLPGIDQLHSPFRWKFPLTVALCVLAALGFDRWTNARSSLQRALALAVAAAGALTVVGVVAARLAWPLVSDPTTALFEESALAPQRFSGPQGLFSYIAGNVALFGLLLVANGVAAALKPGRVQSAALIAVLALDLNVAWVGFAPAVDPALLEVRPAALQPLRDDGEAVGSLKLWRVTSYEPNGAAHAKPANANALWPLGLQDVRGYDSIIPKRYVQYMRAIEPQGDLLYNRISPLRERASLESPLLDLLGVKYVLTENEIDVAGYEELPRVGGLRVYRNTRAMPRAYLLPAGATVAPQDATAGDDFFAQAIRRYDPRRFVLVNDPALCGAAGCASPSPAEFTPATITAYANDEVWIDAPTGTGREWLILNDSWFPGWRAFVRPLGASDDREVEVPVALVNGNFRGVRLDQAGLPADARVATVRFKYSPDSVRFGAFASALAAVSLLFLAGIYGWRSLAASTESLSGAGRIVRNSAVLSGMNIVARLISFAFAIVVARLLGPDGVGAYYFAVVIVGWFEIVLNFGLNTYLTREVARDRAHAAEYFRHTTALRMLLALATAPLLALVLLGGRAVGYFSDVVAVTIAILGLSQVISSLNTGLSALFFAFERGEVPAAVSVVSALATATVGAALLALGWGVPALAITSLLVNLITLAMLALLAARQLGLRFHRASDGFAVRTSRSEMLRESTPLMLNHLLASIEFKLDVPILKAAAPSALIFGAGAVNSEKVVGWYSTGYRFVDAFNIIPSFFTQSLFPALSRMAAQGNDVFMRAFALAVKLLVIVALPLAVGTTFLSTTLAGFFGPEFLPHGAVAISIMAWSMIAGWINSVTNYALIAVNQQRTITRAFAVTLLFNLVANLTLVPLYSYMAAAAVTIGSEIVKGAIFYFYVRRHIGALNWADVLARPALAAGIMAAAAGVGAWAGYLLPGLAAGTLLYAGTLLASRALDWRELKPLLRKP